MPPVARTFNARFPASLPRIETNISIVARHRRGVPSGVECGIDYGFCRILDGLDLLCDIGRFVDVLHVTKIPVDVGYTDAGADAFDAHVFEPR